MVDNSVPTEDEIEWAVKQLRNNRSGGASGMRAEHLLRCSARIPDGPPDWLLRSRLTTHSILSSVGTESSTRNGCTEMGMFFPGGGT